MLPAQQCDWVVFVDCYAPGLHLHSGRVLVAVGLFAVCLELAGLPVPGQKSRTVSSSARRQTSACGWSSLAHVEGFPKPALLGSGFLALALLQPLRRLEADTGRSVFFGAETWKGDLATRRELGDLRGVTV